MTDTPFTRDAGVAVPLICGPMYPCSNPELVAAVSDAGGLGVVQPISLVYVYRHDLREGLRKIRARTAKPIGMNVIVEKSSKTYEDRMKKWVALALEEGIRFFITSLGDPKWVAAMAAEAGGVVYHDVVDARWARKGLDSGAKGLIAVNGRAGGHAGTKEPRALLDELSGFGVPVVCAGGVGSPEEFAAALRIGYAGVQMGTRFIATEECQVHASYKNAIVEAEESDVVLTERVTGVPLSVIRNEYVKRAGTTAGPVSRFLLRNPRTKKWVRTLYALRALRGLRSASQRDEPYGDVWQAGKSVATITSVEPAAEIVRRFAAAAA